MARTSANTKRQAVVVEDTPNTSPNQRIPPNQPLPAYVILDTDEENEQEEKTDDTDNSFCAICNRTLKNPRGLNTHNSRVHKKK